MARSILSGIAAGLGHPSWAAVGVSVSWKDYEDIAVQLGTTISRRSSVAVRVMFMRLFVCLYLCLSLSLPP